MNAGAGKKNKMQLKQFGYIISAIIIILTVISEYSGWTSTPWLYILCLYFLTGSLWITALIRPFYSLFISLFRKTGADDKNSEIKDKFSKN
jgi:hypothetical protein